MRRNLMIFIIKGFRTIFIPIFTTFQYVCPAAFFRFCWLQASNNTGILYTCTRLWLTESEQTTTVDSKKHVVWSSMKFPEFDKHLKKAGGHIGRHVVEITTQMTTIVRKNIAGELFELVTYKDMLFKNSVFIWFHVGNNSL